MLLLLSCRCWCRGLVGDGGEWRCCGVIGVVVAGGVVDVAIVVAAAVVSLVVVVVVALLMLPLRHWIRLLAVVATVATMYHQCCHCWPLLPHSYLDQHGCRLICGLFY